MKRFIFYTLCLFSLSFSHVATANISTQNLEGVVITFIDAIKNSLSEEILSQAISLQGTKYKYGGSSPQTGFDCSGFVNYVFNKAADIKLPRTTRGLHRVGQEVSQQQLQAGDLVFFNTNRRAFSHVGIYIGDGDFIHAPRTGSTVRVENMQTGYWKQRYNGAKRLEEVATN